MPSTLTGELLFGVVSRVGVVTGASVVSGAGITVVSGAELSVACGVFSPQPEKLSNITDNKVIEKNILFIFIVFLLNKNQTM